MTSIADASDPSDVLDVFEMDLDGGRLDLPGVNTDGDLLDFTVKYQ